MGGPLGELCVLMGVASTKLSKTKQATVWCLFCCVTTWHIDVYSSKVWAILILFISLSDSDREFRLPVSISRHKLVPRPERPHPSSPPLSTSGGDQFSLAPGLQDRLVEGEMEIKRKKKKKKHHHFQLGMWHAVYIIILLIIATPHPLPRPLDQVHKAHTHRYNMLVETILEQSDQGEFVPTTPTNNY